MKYTIQRALQKLWLNRKTNFFLALELAIGIAVVLCAHLSSRAASDRLEGFEKQFEQGDIVVEGYLKSFYTDETAITYTDYRDFLVQYGDRCSFRYYLYDGIAGRPRNGGELENYVLLSMNTEAFCSLFGAGPQEAVYVGSETEKVLAAGGVIWEENWFRLDRDGAQVGKHTMGQILPLNTSLKTLMVRTLEGFDLDISRLVVLPESMMEAMEVGSGGKLSSFLLVRPDSGTKKSSFDGIIQELTLRHPSYIYEFTNQVQDMEKSISDLTSTIRLLGWVSQLALAVTTVGIVGVLFLFLQVRRREYAIALSQGATHGVLFHEIFCEVFLLNSIGGIAGAAIAAICCPVLSNSMFRATFRWSAIPVMLSITVTITLSVCVCTLGGLRSIYPSKLLQG